MESETLDYSRHFLNWHNDSPEHVAKMVRYYRQKIIPLLPHGKDLRILDIGCGMGFFLKALAESGYTRISGIDSDASQVASCKAKGLDVELTQDSFGYLEANAGQFDLITAFDVIEHIPPPVQVTFARKVFTGLSAAGIFVLTTPNATSFLASRNRYVDYTHHALFTEVSLDFVLYNGGFRQIRVEPMEYVTFPFSVKSFLHRILFSFFRGLRRLQYMAELGTEWGRKIPLSFNLIAFAGKDGRS